MQKRCQTHKEAVYNLKKSEMGCITTTLLLLAGHLCSHPWCRKHETQICVFHNFCVLPTGQATESNHQRCWPPNHTLQLVLLQAHIQPGFLRLKLPLDQPRQEVRFPNTQPWPRTRQPAFKPCTKDINQKNPRIICNCPWGDRLLSPLFREEKQVPRSPPPASIPI